MTDHAIVERTGDRVTCRCGETFASEREHEAHWSMAKATAVAADGLAEARAALAKGES
jgi:hypothetical protein